jgi:hypothetical protein
MHMEMVPSWRQTALPRHGACLGSLEGARAGAGHTFGPTGVRANRRALWVRGHRGFGGCDEPLPRDARSPLIAQRAAEPSHYPVTSSESPC